MKRLLPYLVPCLLAATMPATALAQGPSSSASVPSADQPEQRNLTQWLARLQQASRHRAYVGTFVVSSANGRMSSSRIWHVCNGEQQVERVEALTGAPRSTFRLNDEVVTFLPHSRQVIQERREPLRLFPDLLKSNDHAITDFYSLRFMGRDRVAGVDADVLFLVPKDGFRYGYRIWSERDTGLVVQLQTVDAHGATLEQSAFSELQLNAPVNMEQLLELMHNTRGYSVERLDPVPSASKAQDWVLQHAVPGFKLVSCTRRALAPSSQPRDAGGASAETVQWIYTDGLASVSLFVQARDRQDASPPVSLAMGATRLLSRRVQDGWLTVVGEVPLQTLQAFAQGLHRAR